MDLPSDDLVRQIKPRLFHEIAEDYFEQGVQTLMPAVGKAVFVKGWQLRGECAISLDDLLCATEHYTEHNLSVVYGSACPIIAIDIDLTDAAQADGLEELVFEVLGGTPLVSIGNAPKRKLIYAKADGWAQYRSRKFRPVVEIFADSGQTILEGIHPDTKRPYTWRGPSLADVPVWELPKVTTSRMALLETAITEYIAEVGLDQPQSPMGVMRADRTRPAWQGSLDDELARMKMERRSASTPAELRATIISHVDEMQPGNRHAILMTSVAAMVHAGWTDDEIWAVMLPRYIERFGDHHDLRTNKVLKAIQSSRRTEGLQWSQKLQ